MSTVRTLITKQHIKFLRFLFKFHNTKSLPVPAHVYHYSTTVDFIDVFTNDLLQKHKQKLNGNSFILPPFSIQQYFTKIGKPRDVSTMTDEELHSSLIDLMTKNKEKEIEQLVLDCHSVRRLINDEIMRNMFRHYGDKGKIEMIMTLQKYTSRVIPNLYQRNGKFTHALAKAQCMKGNSEIGLSLLKYCYSQNENLRCLYRVIFKELIQDTVMNRSEATMVVFKKYVLEFSELFEEHYPMVCLWHICWSSSWYSDQMMADELLDSSAVLQSIVQDKATSLSIIALRDEYNEDAVIRLLQVLLKYDMMVEYAKILQVLFNYKLRNRDIRGCTEILRNCDVLGITLPSNQQGRYIRMLIEGKADDTKKREAPLKSNTFKFKF